MVTGGVIQLENVATEWVVKLELDIVSIKNLDVLPHIMQQLDNLQPIRDSRSIIATILSEAYNNALDYGLLKLDASLKNSVEGCLSYYKERQRCLDNMSTGSIKISVKYEVTAGAIGRLIIEISDTGEGFDYKKYDADISRSKKYSGRGIALLTKLCTAVEYSAKGNQLKLVCDLW
ncbi:MAG: ATP-binding protein [Gammaproteobacteria bacterium]|nr:ATP-binding protein [Gammaproteobacteria bacterium]